MEEHPPATSETPQPRSAAAIDPVERALAEALEGATAAKEWKLVGELAAQLDARRLAREREATGGPGLARVASLAEARAAKKDG